MVNRKYKTFFDSSFYDIQNIIHSMAQESITAMNLIIEAIEIRNADTIKMIDAIKEELNSNQNVIDALCFDMLQKNEITDINILWECIFAADLYEKIGLNCISAGKHLLQIMPFLDDMGSDVVDLLLFLKRVQNILTLVSGNFFQKKNNVCLDIECEINILSKLKDLILNNLILKMKENDGLTPICSEMIFMVTNLFGVGKCILEIYKRICDD